MYTYLCRFTLDGHRREQTITADSLEDARARIESQYPGCRLAWVYCTAIEEKK